MRLALLAAALLLSLHTCLCAVPASVLPPADSIVKPPLKNTVHDKGKGTIGFISGLLLGPVGLGGVYLFSHNRAQRRSAKKGCVIFATVVVAAAFCWLIILGAKNLKPGSGSGGSNHSGSGGGSSRSAGSGSSGGSGRSGASVGGHGSNSNWANNINFPNISLSSSTPKKKPVPDQLPPTGHQRCS